MDAPQHAGRPCQDARSYRRAERDGEGALRRLRHRLTFDKRQQGCAQHQDWRPEGNPAAPAAFGHGVRLMR